VLKVRAWWNANCSGTNISYHGSGDTYWNQINNDVYSSYKTFSDYGDGYPSSPSACVNAT
jgi:hypothetical protein